ncbi:MAG: hypothetical protein WB562_09645 [Candidatus Sulfotelmatobacter sp.]
MATNQNLSPRQQSSTGRVHSEAPHPEIHQRQEEKTASPVAGITQRIFLGLSAGTGGLLSVWSDIAQKPDANDIDHLQLAVGKVLGVTTYPWVIALTLIVIAVGVSFIFAAESNKKAFYTGASVLAMTMTLAPYRIPDPLNMAPAPTRAAAGTDDGWWDRFVIPPVVFAQNGQAAAHDSPVDVHLQTDDKKPVTSAIFSLIDSNNGQVIARSKVQTSDFTFYAPNRPCTLRVQVDGYTIAERSLNPAPRTLTIPLTASAVPVGIQRLFRK